MRKLLLLALSILLPLSIQAQTHFVYNPLTNKWDASNSPPGGGGAIGGATNLSNANQILCTSSAGIAKECSTDSLLDKLTITDPLAAKTITFTGYGLLSGTYTSGITATGTVGQTCALTLFNGGNTGGTATVALTGTNVIAGGTALVITAAGSGSTSAATSATVGNGTATCTGPATVATALTGFVNTFTSLGTSNSSFPVGTHSLAPLDSPTFSGTVTSTGLVNATGAEGSQYALTLGGQQWKLNMVSGGALYINDITGSHTNFQIDPGSAQSYRLGTTSHAFVGPVTTTTTFGVATVPATSIYLGNAATNNIRLTGTSAAARVVTIPDIGTDTGATVALSPTSTTTTQALFATATAGLYGPRAIANADLPVALINTPVSLTDNGTTIATNAALSNQFLVTALTANVTLSNPTNSVNGQKITWEVIQNAVAAKTLAFDTNFKFGAEITACTISTTLSSHNFINAQFNSTTGKWNILGCITGY